MCHNSRTGFFKSASLKVNEPVSLGLVVHWSEVVNPADPSRLTQQYVRSYVVCSIKDSANRLLARSVRELIRETPAKFAAVSRHISLHTNAIVLSFKKGPDASNTYDVKGSRNPSGKERTEFPAPRAVSYCSCPL